MAVSVRRASLEGVAVGEHGAPVDADLAAFVGGHYRELVRTAYLLCGDASDAEDLVQEALARAWSARRTALIDNPRAYLRRTMLNVHLSRLRRRRVRTEIPVELVPEPLSSSTGRSDPAADVVLRDQLWRLLATLPRRQRAVLVLRYVEDQPEAVVADLLRVSVGTVRSQTWKALRRLQEQLDAPEGSDPR